MLLSTVGIRPVLVHGGGPEINSWLDKARAPAAAASTATALLRNAAHHAAALAPPVPPSCPPASRPAPRPPNNNNKTNPHTHHNNTIQRRHQVGIEAKFKEGLRVTDAATMEIVEMVLGGRVNKGLVSLIQQAGGTAVGLSGKDGGLLRARQMIEKDIGFVGEVTKVRACAGGGWRA